MGGVSLEVPVAYGRCALLNHACRHVFTAVVGAGVLNLPYVLKGFWIVWYSLTVRCRGGERVAKNGCCHVLTLVVSSYPSFLLQVCNKLARVDRRAFIDNFVLLVQSTVGGDARHVL